MNRIKKLREEKSLTQAELGKALGVSSSQIYYYETEKRSPRTEDFWEKIADYFDVSIAYIRGYSDLKKGENLVTEVSSHILENNLVTTDYLQNLKEYDVQAVDFEAWLQDLRSLAAKKNTDEREILIKWIAFITTAFDKTTQNNKLSEFDDIITVLFELILKEKEKDKNLYSEVISDTNKLNKSIIKYFDEDTNK